MSTATTDEADATFWKTYAAAFQKAVSQLRINDKTSFYIATKAQAGSPAEDMLGFTRAKSCSTTRGGPYVHRFSLQTNPPQRQTPALDWKTCSTLLSNYV